MYPENNYLYLDYLWMLGGLYVAPKTSKKRYIFYAYNTFVVLMCQIWYYPAEMSKIPECMQSLEILVEHVGMLINHSLGYFKILIIAWNRARIEKIKETLENDDFKYESCDGYDPGKHMFKCRFIQRGLAILFFILGSMVPFSKEFRYWLLLRKGWLYVGNGTVVCQDLLPYYSWFPFDIEYPEGCLIGFYMQFLPMMIFLYQIIACDLVYLSISLYIRGHLVNLRGAFRTMRKRCLVRIGLPDDYEVMHDTDVPALEKEVAGEVRKMSIHLQTILRTCDEMEDIFKYILLGQVLTVLLALVPCLYIISSEELFSPLFIIQLSMVAGLNLQLTSFSAMANEVTDNCAAVSEGIYESDWFSCSKDVKTNLIINSIRLQKAVHYTVGGFTPLLLGTCLQILKGSYSYYTVLTKS